MTYFWETAALIASKRVDLPEGLTVDLHVTTDPDCPDFDCAEGDYSAEDEAAARRGDFTFVAVYLVPVLFGAPCESAYSSAHEIPFGNLPGRAPFASPAAEAEHLMTSCLPLLLQYQAEDARGTGAELARFGQYAHAYDDQLVRKAVADPYVRANKAALAAIDHGGGEFGAVDARIAAALCRRGLTGEQPAGCWRLTRIGGRVLAALDAATRMT